MSGDVVQAMTELERRLNEALARYEAQARDGSRVAEELRSEVRVLADQVADIARRRSGGVAGSATTSLGRALIESREYSAWRHGQAGRVRFEARNTLTSAGSLVQEQRLPGVVPGGTIPTTLLDVVPQIPIASNAIELVREQTLTNNASGVAEGDAKPESDITVQSVTYPVRTIATWMRISRQLAEDEPAIAAYIDQRLGYAVRQAVNAQMLTGTGANNLSGVFTTGNYTVYAPSSGDNALDAITRAVHQLWASGYVADTAIVNPSTWGALRIAKGSDGHYLFAPGQLDVAAPVRVIMHPNMGAAQFLVGAFSQFSLAAVREAVTVELFEQDQDNAIRNLITVRAEVRMAFAVLRPAAFLGGNISS